MPSKARQLAKAMVENPIIEDMVTTPAAIPQTIVTETSTAASAIDANFNYATVDVLPGSANVGDQAFVQSNNRLYIWNGSGWYSIALINSTPTWDSGGQPDATYVLDADSPQDATIINLSASDPEDLSINYSYITSGSMDSMATISQDSSVFTITPKTEAQVGEGVELTGSITFRASDGINILPQVSSFTLNFVTAIENSNHTTILAAAVNTSDNNNITDASTNSHSITVSGDAHVGTFSPYRRGGYSTYFDGSGDYIDTGLNNVATDFTFECWVNTAAGGMLMARYASGSALDGFMIDLTSGFPIIQINTNANNLNGTVNLKDGKWHHLAFVRDSNVCKIFVDGVLDVSQTDSEPMQVNANWIIGRHGNASTYYYTGYIRDLRWAVGTVRYTSNFTPPTEPLTALSGDNLFTCHLPYIVDGSSTPYTMTAYGNVATKPFSPYDHSPYSAIEHGGSLYFDGNGDAIEIADNDDFDFGTGDLTIECWVYPEETGNNYPGFLGTTAGWGSVAASGMRFDNLGDSKFQMSWYGPGDPFLETQSSYPHNQWYHFVVTRTGGNTWRMFINGILEDTGTNSTAYDICAGGHSLQVGGKTWDGGNGWFKGSVADLRLTKGSVITEYQTSSTTTGTQIFTPRTVPIASSGSELHLKGIDASVIDKSQTTNLKLIGDTTGSTTQVKFANTKSIYADGSGDFVEVPIDPIGSGDFTVECWVYPTFLSGSGTSGIFTGATIGGEAGPVIADDFWWLGSNSGGISFSNSGSKLQLNQWQHVAISREGSTARAFYNGTLFDTQTTAINLGQTTMVLFARYTGKSSPSGGYIQDFRLTKGLARYTTNFTPPTAELEG